MKLDARRVARFLDDPGPCRFVLLHGEDAGLIRERAETLSAAILDAQDDPFRLVRLTREETSRLAEEAQALSLVGGRRVVRLREAGDAALPQVQAAAAAPGDSLVILEAPGLPGRSKLRSFIEGLAEGAAIACYPEEGRALDDAIRAVLAADAISVAPDALDWLRDHLGADHAHTRAELEKLALYVGSSGEVDVAAAEACIGEAASLSVEDAVFAAVTGEVAAADRALAVAFAEGAAPVSILRIMMQNLQRLHRARLSMEETGARAADAARQARPPIFFRRLPAFTGALSAWSGRSLLRALTLCSETELACKRTGSPDVTLCQQLVGQIARQAAMLRRRN